MITFANQLRDTDAQDTTALFERTYRADKAGRGSSAGLGLYIVKLQAQKQKAEVRHGRRRTCFI